ncbi:hypothetical protein G3580_17220 [Nitrogeniibacter mangrovi]|uniref:DUF4136 domain-containing protein n=1 Tax=Nitrogeniibacter mangrovi TaxID=2016596 RepID=A0A6C1BAB2_9RHOO|nr:hypothetical protein [Nitrogeniibacter mangrovi]QID19204.1 hypothetical protein G3580_17220 [Nitrogeniibacter mangrovi]
MMLRLLVLLASLVSLTGCATGLYHPVWTAEDAPTIRLGRTVAAVLVPSESDRRLSEDAFVQYLQPAMDMTALHAAAGKGSSVPGSVDEARTQARTLGFDSLLVARVVETYEREIYRPTFGFYAGTHPYYGLWGRFPFDYWDRPGYVDTVRRSVIEVSLYSTHTKALIWSGKAETFATDSFVDQVEPLADALLKDLVARGIVR